MSFRVSGQDYLTAPAMRPVDIPARSSVSVPLQVGMPVQAGRLAGVAAAAGEQRRRGLGADARRTLIPSGGGSFQARIIGTSARDVGQINTYEINVPAGAPSLNVALHATDDSADNPFRYYLVSPSGTVVATANTPQTVNGQVTGDAEPSTASPAAGIWQIDVVLRLTVSGNEFDRPYSAT